MKEVPELRYKHLLIQHVYYNTNKICVYYQEYYIVSKDWLIGAQVHNYILHSKNSSGANLESLQQLSHLSRTV